MTLTITTYDWVPEFPRGYVRDLRIRWACEEAGLPYTIDTVPLRGKTPDHLARQPFHQVPMLRDGDLDLFESGAILLYLGEKSGELMPTDAKDRAKVIQWVVAALSSVEPATTGWTVAKFFDKDEVATTRTETRMNHRLSHLDAAMAGRDYLVGSRFTAADLLMADVLRTVGDEGALNDLPRLAAYVRRITGRPAFVKAHADQIAHFTAADTAVG